MIVVSDSTDSLVHALHLSLDMLRKQLQRGDSPSTRYPRGVMHARHDHAIENHGFMSLDCHLRHKSLTMAAYYLYRWYWFTLYGAWWLKQNALDLGDVWLCWWHQGRTR